MHLPRVILMVAAAGLCLLAQDAAYAVQYFVSLRDSYVDIGNNQVAKVSDNGATFNVDNPSFFDTSFLHGPTGIAKGPNGNYFVANAFSNTIEEFNPQTGAHVGQFADASDGLQGPSALRYYNGSFYVANLGDPLTQNFGSTVVKIDATTGVASTFISGLQGPDGLLFDPSGNVYVSEAEPYFLGFNGNGDPILEYHVSKFDSSGTLIGAPLTDPLLNFPTGLTFLPNSTDVLVANTLGQTVAKYDGSFSLYADLSAFSTPYPSGLTVVDANTLWISGASYAGLFKYNLDALGNPTFNSVLATYASFGIASADFGISIGDLALVPEPSSLLLATFGAGLFGFIRRGRRRR